MLDCRRDTGHVWNLGNTVHETADFAANGRLRLQKAQNDGSGALEDDEDGRSLSFLICVK